MNLNDLEKDLTVLIKKGDEKAFKELYLSFYKAVTYFINDCVQDSESAQDLTQETFFYLWENRTRLDPSKGCRSYILAIARSKALNYLRDTKYDQQYIYSINQQQEQDLHLNNKDITIDTILNKDLLNRINIEIHKLPQKQKEVMILSRKKYLLNKEIAQILQISVKTVEYRLVTALRQIRQNIEKT